MNYQEIWIYNSYTYLLLHILITTYLVKLKIPPDQVILADFKNVLNRNLWTMTSGELSFLMTTTLIKNLQHAISFLFKITVTSCEIWIITTIYFVRVVKEEIVDDDAHLPCFNGRVISWGNKNLSKNFPLFFIKPSYHFPNFISVSVGWKQYIWFSISMCREHCHHRWETSYFPVIH